MKAKKLTDFSEKVLKAVKSIPQGKVATYSQIARIAGKEHGSRGVAWILHSSSRKHKLPWWRVINARGEISFPKLTSYYVRQKNLLKKEGVEFSFTDKINMTKFQWSRRSKA